MGLKPLCSTSACGTTAGALRRGTGTETEGSFNPATTPDSDLDEKAARNITKYRELYRDHRRQLDYLPAIASTSGRIHCELLRLLFLRAKVGV